MKKGFLALCLFGALSAFGQSDPSEMNLSFETDILFVRESKTRLSIGARSLTGMKSSFSGSGRVQSTNSVGEPTGHSVTRIYHDGAVGADLRTVRIDDGNGGTIAVKITPDGLTDNWRYSDARQVQLDGTIAMHVYTADIADGGPRSKDPASSYGIELAVTRDIGRLTPRFNWSVVGGLSLNGISSRLTAAETATITTLTDSYSLAGASAPAAPYQSRSGSNEIQVTENVFDANGNPVLNPDGSPLTRTVGGTVLIPDEPQTRTTTVTTNDTSVTNHFRLKGAYFTMRAGPSIVLPITTNLRATLSVGAALVFAGTNYEVEQSFLPDTASEISDTITDREARLLPGYFADANMEYTLSERAGFYAGAVYQNTGSYTQKIETASASYSTKVDLSAMSGFHFGMNVRF